MVLPVGRDGSSYYRITQPYAVMARQGLADIIFVNKDELETPEFWIAIKECDFVATRMANSDFILNWLDKYVPNKKVIIDIDDNIWDVNPYQDIYRWHGTQEVRHGDKWLWKDGESDFNIRRNKRRLERDNNLFRRANIITVSTERLEKLVSEYNKNTKVIYNSIDFNKWKPYNLEKKEFRVGWSGGVSHYADIIGVKEDFEYLLKKHKNMKLVIAGTVFDGFTKGLPKEQIEFLPWVDIEAHPYRTILMNLDLAFIPIAKNSFNECKSCVKWYEFASIKVPTIATNYPPYSDEMPELALTDNFREKIEQLMNAKAIRDKNADYSYNWVVKNRNINNEAKKLYEFISKPS